MRKLYTKKKKKWDPHKLDQLLDHWFANMVDPIPIQNIHTTINTPKRIQLHKVKKQRNAERRGEELTLVPLRLSLPATLTKKPDTSRASPERSH